MLNGYTFHMSDSLKSKLATRWRCSVKKNKCKAYVILSEDEHHIIRGRIDHDHVPRIYKVGEDGKYARAKLNTSKFVKQSS